MSDKFGRHKSTRWVRASVPQYGDDWNDDSDYEYGSRSEDEHEVHYEASKVEPQRFVLPSEAQAGASRESLDSAPPPPPGAPLETPPAPSKETLVLSIDNLAQDSDSDNDNVNDFAPPKLAAQDVHSTGSLTFSPETKAQLDQSQAAPIVNTVVNASHDDFEPPTPVYSTKSKIPETPTSEASFTSDADSIQHETDLHVYSQTASFRDEAIPEKEDPELDKPPSREATPRLAPAAPVETPLVLSIDKFDVNSNDSDDDPVPYYEKQPSHPDYDIDSDDEEPHRTRDSANKTNEALDNLIHDLQSASMTEEGKEMLPTLDSMQDIKLPDFDNSYDYNYYDDSDEEDANPVTPIAPLSSKDEKAFHEKFVSQLSGHKPSVRKPPTASGDTASLASSVRKPTDSILSPTYSSFGDAVDVYANEKDSGSEREKTPADHEYPQEDKAADELSLQPVQSTGSLSTGKLSVENGPQEPTIFTTDRDINRRDSTNTINMGNWKPNTNNFRDQFINDNDNESQINFNMYGNDNNVYNKFTKRQSSDAMSTRSSLSIPETVDIALPSIDEDPDDNADHDDTFNSAETPKEHPLAQVRTSESYFSDTSNSIAATTSLQQRYSSLLGSGDESKDVSQGTPNSFVTAPSSKRVVSDSSLASTGTKKSYVPSAYPVSNWKSIMKPSQSIDRIRLLKDALEKENEYETGLQNWLKETLKKSDNTNNMHIGKIATQAYQNAAHSDLRRHTSIRSRVSSVKDKVETSGISASNLGKRFFHRGKKLMKSSLE